MLDGIINVVLLLAILVLLVVLHELGHFLVARRARVRVHEFGIGFPPRAAVLHRGPETTYTLNWLPIGGFVRMEGEQGESVDPRAFVNQRLATRLVILVAGVVVNALVAWVIFTGIAAFADPVWQVRIGAVQPGSPAEAAGLQGGQQVDTIVVEGREVPIYDATGDLIVAVDGQRFPVFESLDATRSAPLQYLYERPGQEVDLTVRRPDGSEEVVSATLRPAGQLDQGALGIAVQGLEREDVQNGLLDAAAIGLRRTVDAGTLILRGVADFVTNLTNPQVSGPIGIVGAVGVVRTELPPTFLIWLVGLLSANLAVINALPFPPLDGGRVAMAFIGAASRGRLRPETERLVYFTGFILLMALMVWITVFDIQRMGGG
jgi:regulator of sigma E protease